MREYVMRCMLKDGQVTLCWPRMFWLNTLKFLFAREEGTHVGVDLRRDEPRHVEHVPQLAHRDVMVQRSINEFLTDSLLHPDPSLPSDRILDVDCGLREHARHST